MFDTYRKHSLHSLCSHSYGVPQWSEPTSWRGIQLNQSGSTSMASPTPLQVLINHELEVREKVRTLTAQAYQCPYIMATLI
jgi:hypothetical protein